MKSDAKVSMGAGSAPGRVEVVVVDAEAMAGEAGRAAGGRERHGKQQLEAEARGVGKQGAEASRMLRQHVAHKGGAAVAPSRSVRSGHLCLATTRRHTTSAATNIDRFTA